MSEKETGIPMTPEEAEILVAELLKKGLLNPSKLKEIGKQVSQTATEVQEVYLGHTVSNDVESQIPTVTFATAADVLKKEANFDLRKMLHEDTRMHERWGIVKALKEKRVIKDTVGYRQLFSTTTLTQTGLNELIAKLNEGEKWSPIFSPGHMTLLEIWELLIKNKIIPITGESNDSAQKMFIILNRIGAIRRIEPNSIKDLETMDCRPEKVRIAAVKQAYERAIPNEVYPPKMLFTPDTWDVPRMEPLSSPLDKLRLAAIGQSFIDPFSDIIHWAKKFEQNDYDLSSIDGQCSSYPLHFFNSMGGIAGIVCDDTWGEGIWLNEQSADAYDTDVDKYADVRPIIQ